MVRVLKVIGVFCLVVVVIGFEGYTSLMSYVLTTIFVSSSFTRVKLSNVLEIGIRIMFIIRRDVK